jgi:sulfatase modifying factor 1
MRTGPRAGWTLIALALSVSVVAVTDADPPVAPCGSAPAGMACVAGGPFVRGSDSGSPDAKPAATVFVQTFYMDLLEVTYGVYKACVRAGNCADAGPNYGDFNRPRQPITGVSWYDAVKFCEVKGKHLPTEAEWEKAARGPDGGTFPWGDEPATCERAVIKDRRGRSCGVPKRGKRPDKGRPFEVGSKPPGVYGLYDMAGNSWEWVYDWYGKSYGTCGDACLGVNPRGPCGGAEKCPGHRRRVVRGGSWYWEARLATGYYRRAHVPGNDPFHHFGFRCAASVEEVGAPPLKSVAWLKRK